MARKRFKRSTYPVSTALLDSLAYIADGLGAPYPSRPFEALTNDQLMTAHSWARRQLNAVEAEIAARPDLGGVALWPK